MRHESAMKLEEFNLLDRTTQSEILFSNGHQIASVKISEHGYFLYKIHGHYSEVEFDFNNGKIAQIIAFKNGERLNKYLKKSNFSR